MPPARFEPAIPESERPQTHASDRAAAGIGTGRVLLTVKCGQPDQVSQSAGKRCVSINRHYIVLFYTPVHSSPYVILCCSYMHLSSAL
jgi:hypothetical protein